MNDNFISSRRLSRHLHHDSKELACIFKSLVDMDTTYMIDGEKRPLIHVVPRGKGKIYCVDNNAMAIQAVEQAFMKFKDYTDSDRSLFYSSFELAALLKKDRKMITRVLKKLYQEKKTYEVDGDCRPVVVRTKGVRRVGYMVEKNETVLAFLKKMFHKSCVAPRVPREQFLLPFEISKRFGVDPMSAYAFIRSAYKQGVTYIDGDQEKPLVHKYPVWRGFAWVVDRNAEALSEFRHFVRPFVREETLVNRTLGRPSVVHELLEKLYHEKTKYEYHGRTHNLVHTYRSPKGGLRYGVDSREVAWPIFQEKLSEYKRQIEGRVPVKHVNLHNLLTNTTLTREDVAYLGCGFRTRVAEVRREANQWAQLGVPMRRLFAQVQPEREEMVFDKELLKKVSPSTLKEWRSKVLGLMTILMAIEMSKTDGTDYKVVLADKTKAGRRKIREKWRFQQVLGTIPFGPLKSGSIKE